MWFYVNGQFVEDADAKVSVTDRSFLYGDGCFEGLGVTHGRIPHLDDHIARFFRSARMLRIAVPLNPEQLKYAILETGARNGMRDVAGAYMRPLLSRGSGPLGVKNSRKVGPPNLVIIPQLSGRETLFGDHIPICNAVITRFVRPGGESLDPGIKSNNYLTSILAFMEAQDQDPDVEVAVVHDPQGFLAEGHAMNLFCVSEGKVLSPMSSGALRGITRHHVLNVARELGYETIETNLSDYDLVCADEAFITSAMESIAAIGKVNGAPMKGPVPGPITVRLRKAYLEHALTTATEIPPTR
jgi:branched-chain amino acid aminotransferase